MPAEQHHVTRHDVEQLWDDAILGRLPASGITSRAEALINRVSAENPVVNWGLTDLYHVHRRPPSPWPDLVALRSRWRLQLATYDAEPDAWMRAYCRSMISDFARRHGADRGRAFGLKLVQSGQLTPDDVADALRRVADSPSSRVDSPDGPT